MGGCTYGEGGGVVALCPVWLNCSGPQATPSSGVWLVEVTGSATAIKIKEGVESK